MNGLSSLDHDGRQVAVRHEPVETSEIVSEHDGRSALTGLPLLRQIAEAITV